MVDRATHDQLGELWGSLLRCLLVILKSPDKPSAEMLSIARKFVRDNGHAAPPDEAARKLLEVLQRSYLEALVAAFDDGGQPTAALLGECRQFLRWSGVSPDGGAPAAAATAAELLALDVPFKTQ